MYEMVRNAFEMSLKGDGSTTPATPATPPFAGDLENETYLAILNGIRSFNPDLYVPEEKKEEPVE